MQKLIPQNEIFEFNLEKFSATRILIWKLERLSSTSKLAFDLLSGDIYKGAWELWVELARTHFREDIDLILAPSPSEGLQGINTGVQEKIISLLGFYYWRSVHNNGIVQTIRIQQQKLSATDPDTQDRVKGHMFWMGIARFRSFLAILTDFEREYWVPVSTLRGISYAWANQQDSKSTYFFAVYKTIDLKVLTRMVNDIPGLEYGDALPWTAIRIPQSVFERYNSLWGNQPDFALARQACLGNAWDSLVLKKWGFKNPFPPKPADNPLLTPHKA